MIRFGAQLIGQTEKSLNTILSAVLADRDLSESEWVTLRLTAQFDGTGALSAHVHDGAHFSDVDALLTGLNRRGLVDGSRLTEHGREFLDRAERRIAELTAPIWDALPPDDTAAAARVLTTVLERSRSVIASLPVTEG